MISFIDNYTSLDRSIQYQGANKISYNSTGTHKTGNKLIIANDKKN
jgi:hypothetical protein